MLKFLNSFSSVNRSCYFVSVVCIGLILYQVGYRIGFRRGTMSFDALEMLIRQTIEPTTSDWGPGEWWGYTEGSNVSDCEQI